jgi:GT2 family glycosyltransferase
MQYRRSGFTEDNAGCGKTGALLETVPERKKFAQDTYAMAAPLVSIVMSVYNGDSFLCEAMDSILRQSFSDFEFLIVDDGSTDCSASILDSYERIDPRVHVYRQGNSGLIASLNSGCGIARGKYIARMDSDDIAMKERVMSQVHFMEAHPTVAVLGGAVQLIDAAGKVLSTARYPVKHCEIQQALLDSNVMWHPTVLMRKAAFVAVGGYRNVVHAEDYDLWLRIAEHYQLANLVEVILKYRIHPAQGSVTRCRKQALGALTAKVSASARRNGKQDPLDSVMEITLEALAGMGVDESTRQTAIARGYLSCIRNMRQSGRCSLAREMIETLDAPEFMHAERWVLADTQLCAAIIYWRERKLVRSLLSLGRALVRRPIIILRPIKPLLHLLKTMRVYEFCMARK